MTNLLTKNFGYTQQYLRHVRGLRLDGRTSCSCKLWCADDAMYADKVTKVTI